VPAGSGPGHITADGCAVDLYAELRAGREPDLIAAAVRPDARILELGSGAGRVTNELVSRGFQVVAVDESAEMLRHIHGTETIQAGIEQLNLGRQFDAVLLCSHLINTPDSRQRHEFVSACARHVAAGGCVIIERHNPDWFDTAVETAGEHDRVGHRLRDISRPAPGRLAATMEYRIGSRVWTQSFTAERIDDDRLAAVLAENRLVVDCYLDEDRSWVRAVPGGEG
jgi:SAM-dependent methyltransferase